MPAGDPADLDWTLIRSFLAVMREGTLTRAAQALGLTQPTLGRHIRDIERMAGEPLFARRGNRLDPTEAAHGMFERGKNIEQAVVALGRAIVGAPDDMAGTVRITTSTVLGVELLPRLLPELLAAVPGLEVEVIARDTVDNLLRRDADLAIRHVMPDQADLIVARAGEIGIGLYATQSYLNSVGTPKTIADLAEVTLIASETGSETLKFATAYGLKLPRSRLRVRADNLLIRVAAVGAGLGIGPCQHWLAAERPGLVRVLPELEVGRLPVFLVAHDDLRRSRRLRGAYDHLLSTLRERFRS